MEGCFNLALLDAAFKDVRK